MPTVVHAVDFGVDMLHSGFFEFAVKPATLADGYGVLAPRSSWRSEVVLGRVSPTPAQLERRSADVLSRNPSPSKAPRWTPWRELLKRSFGVDGWACPYCDQRMRLRAVVLPPATLKILRGLQAACRAPPGSQALAG